jgi:Glycosyl hydrolase family 47
MGAKAELREAVAWAGAELSFDIDKRVHVFELTIRALGGLLSAHALLDADPTLVPGGNPCVLAACCLIRVGHGSPWVTPCFGVEPPLRRAPVGAQTGCSHSGSAKDEMYQQQGPFAAPKLPTVYRACCFGCRLQWRAAAGGGGPGGPPDAGV